MLGVGIIGLGRRWRKRYRSALGALRGSFTIRAVCDQIRLRAAAAARRLRCDVVAGPAALLQRDDVQAILLLDRQWFGLWPVELACRFGKPVFCACPLEVDDAHADTVRGQVRNARLPVMVAMAPRFATELCRLREILDAQLGPARLVLCALGLPCRPASDTGSADENNGPSYPPGPAGPLSCSASGRRAGASLYRGGDVALLDWCAGVLGGEPVSTVAVGVRSGDFSSLFFEFSGGRAMQFIRCRTPHARRSLRLEVVAEHGLAAALLPRRVWWTDGAGKHVDVLQAQRPVAQVMLEGFHQAIAAGRPPEPSLEDAYRVLHWLRAADRSWDEERQVRVTE